MCAFMNRAEDIFTSNIAGQNIIYEYIEYTFVKQRL